MLTFSVSAAAVYWWIPAILVQVMIVWRTFYMINTEAPKAASFGGAIVGMVYLMVGTILSLLLWLIAVIGWAFTL